MVWAFVFVLAPGLLGDCVEASEMRISMLKQRDAMALARRRALSAAIGERLSRHPVFVQATQILFFVSHGSELETMDMRILSRRLGKTVAVPRCEPCSRTLKFHLLEEDDALTPGSYGILEPRGDAKLASLAPGTLVLVPGTVFDRRGNRLGMGGGYYDRWLAGEGRGLSTLGLAFHEQLVERVPIGLLDVPVHYLLTDRDSIDCALES